MGAVNVAAGAAVAARVPHLGCVCALAAPCDVRLCELPTDVMGRHA